MKRKFALLIALLAIALLGVSLGQAKIPVLYFQGRKILVK